MVPEPNHGWLGEPFPAHAKCRCDSQASSSGKRARNAHDGDEERRLEREVGRRQPHHPPGSAYSSIPVTPHLRFIGGDSGLHGGGVAPDERSSKGLRTPESGICAVGAEGRHRVYGIANQGDARRTPTSETRHGPNWNQDGVVRLRFLNECFEVRVKPTDLVQRGGAQRRRIGRSFCWVAGLISSKNDGPHHVVIAGYMPDLDPQAFRGRGGIFPEAHRRAEKRQRSNDYRRRRLMTLTLRC